MLPGLDGVDGAARPRRLDGRQRRRDLPLAGRGQGPDPGGRRPPALPTLGICLGHQLVAVALGGRSEPNPAGQQVGLFDIGWTADAADDALLGAVASPRRGVQWNTDVVTELPEGATALAADARPARTRSARFAPPPGGCSCTPRSTGPCSSSWAAGDRDDHLEKGIDQEAVLGEIDAARAELDEAWRPLATRFAELAGRRAMTRAADQQGRRSS